MRHSAEMKDFRRDLVSLLPKLAPLRDHAARNANDADDLVQEVCASGQSRAVTYGYGEGPLESWSNAMTRNLW